MIWMFESSQIFYDDRCFKCIFNDFNCVKLCFMNYVDETMLIVAWTWEQCENGCINIHHKHVHGTGEWVKGIME
jgi:hypothetical protein